MFFMGTTSLKSKDDLEALQGLHRALRPLLRIQVCAWCSCHLASLLLPAFPWAFWGYELNYFSDVYEWNHFNTGKFDVSCAMASLHSGFVLQGRGGTNSFVIWSVLRRVVGIGELEGECSEDLGWSAALQQPLGALPNSCFSLPPSAWLQSLLQSIIPHEGSPRNSGPHWRKTVV